MSHFQDFLGDDMGLGFEIYLFLLQAKDKKTMEVYLFLQMPKT